MKKLSRTVPYSETATFEGPKSPKLVFGGCYADRWIYVEIRFVKV